MPDLNRQIQNFFRDNAYRYDLGVWSYRLMGVDDRRYRREAVAALGLRPGDTAVDLACGTGLDFPLLVRAVGPAGKIIGVDLSREMLDQAGKRTASAGWRNVELVRADAGAYDVPGGTGAVLSTFALYLIPEYDAVIRRAAAALRPGGRLAILDAKPSDHPPAWTALFPRWREQPFGIGPEFLARRPMDSIRRHMREILYTEFFSGYLYLSVGERRPS